jgi:hypothetical protein
MVLLTLLTPLMGLGLMGLLVLIEDLNRPGEPKTSEPGRE